MILAGSMYITTDMNVVMNNLMTSKIVIIGDAQPSLFKQYPQFISGSCIMPSYNLASLLLDNKYDEFDKNYSAYLNSEEVSSFITAIFKAVSVGVNIIFYLSPEEAKMRYSQVFLSFLTSTRGLIVGTATNAFNYNSAFDLINIKYLYLEDLITMQEFLIGIASCRSYLTDMDIVIVNKLARTMNPYIMDKSLTSYINYFNTMINNMIQNNNVYLEPVIVDSGRRN